MAQSPTHPNKLQARLRKSDLLRMALGSLGDHKLRSGLTILGITIGVFSVISVMTALSAVRGAIDSSLSQLGANVFQISRFPGLMLNDGWWNYRHRPPITLREARRFQSVMETQGALVSMQMEDGGERLIYGERSTSSNVNVIGANENYLETNNWDLAYGRDLVAEDMEFNRPVILVGSEVLEKLFPREDPLGKTISIKGMRYEVIGVLQEKGKTFGRSQDNTAIIPITRFMERHMRQWRSIDLSVMAPDASSFLETQDNAIGAMRSVRGLKPENANTFEVFSNDSLREAFAKIAIIVSAGGLIISAIALLAAGVGIMNIMLVSVTERTREIGIRKSLGSKSVDILRQMLLEAIFLSQIGGMGGILLGILVGNGIAIALKVPVVFPWFWAGMAVFVCTLVGCVFGIYPAWKAARLNPIEALRYE